MYSVLLAHNFYRSGVPSGENIAFEAEMSLLDRHHHKTQLFARYSDDIESRGPVGKIASAIGVPCNLSTARAIHQTVEDSKPDVVHVHNTFPLLSPSIFQAIGRRAARVLTLHNYRLFCPAAIPMRDGKVCTECLDRHSAMPSLVYGCYRDSRTATLPLAISVGLHRLLGTWTKHVDAFICLTEFQRRRMVEAGLPAHKVHVKPNFYPGSPEVIPWHHRTPYVVYAGRLTAEKGVISLLRAWQRWGINAPELRIIGDGALRPELERMAAGLPVRFLGQVIPEIAHALISKAHLLVLPSECLETFGLVVTEAFAFGTPAAVSNLGPLPSIVEHGRSGIVFEPADPESMMQEIRAAWETPGFLKSLGLGARLEFEKKYTEETNYRMLMDIYHQAIEVSRNG